MKLFWYKTGVQLEMKYGYLHMVLNEMTTQMNKIPPNFYSL